MLHGRSSAACASIDRYLLPNSLPRFSVHEPFHFKKRHVVADTDAFCDGARPSTSFFQQQKQLKLKRCCKTTHDALLHAPQCPSAKPPTPHTHKMARKAAASLPTALCRSYSSTKGVRKRQEVKRDRHTQREKERKKDLRRGAAAPHACIRPIHSPEK